MGIEAYDEKRYKEKRSSSPDQNYSKRNDILEVNIKESMGDYTKYSKKLYRNID